MVSSIAIQQSQFNSSHFFAHIGCSIWPIDRTRSFATTPGQSGTGSNVNEGVLYMPQIFKTRSLPSDCLMSYRGHSLVGVLLFCRYAVSVFYSPGQLGWVTSLMKSLLGHCTRYHLDIMKTEKFMKKNFLILAVQTNAKGIKAKIGDASKIGNAG